MSDRRVSFDRRALLVTGAGRGIGRALAHLLAERGASVIVADNGSAMDGSEPNGGPAEAVAGEIRALGGDAQICTADLASEEGAREAVERCVEAFGRIDGIAHCASPSPELTTPDKLPKLDIELAMRVNPMAAMWMAKAAWPHMVDDGFGRMVFMPSGAIYGALGNTHYAAAKAAYLGLVRCLALEGAALEIRVNGIMPAARTRMTERFPDSSYARWFFETMSPDKVAVAAAYLLSEPCEVNGEVFAVGGGRIARVTIAEAEGVLDAGASIERVAEAMPQAMADTRFFYPRDLSERSAKVSSVFGFDGKLEASGSYAARSIKPE